MQCINSNCSKNNDEKLLPKKKKKKTMIRSEHLKKEHYKLFPQKQLLPKKPRTLKVIVTI